MSRMSRNDENILKIFRQLTREEWLGAGILPEAVSQFLKPSDRSHVSTLFAINNCTLPGSTALPLTSPLPPNDDLIFFPQHIQNTAMQRR